MRAGKALGKSFRRLWTGLVEGSGEENSTDRHEHRESHQRPLDTARQLRFFLALALTFGCSALASGVRAALNARALDAVLRRKTWFEEMLDGAAAGKDGRRNADKPRN